MIFAVIAAAFAIAGAIWLSYLPLEDEDGLQFDYIPEYKFHRNDEGDDEQMKIGFAVGRIQGRTGVVKSQQGEVKVTFNAALEGEVKRVPPVVEAQYVEVDVMPWVKKWADDKQKGAHIDTSI